jgi:hypothetical protein
MQIIIFIYLFLFRNYKTFLQKTPVVQEKVQVQEQEQVQEGFVLELEPELELRFF